MGYRGQLCATFFSLSKVHFLQAFQGAVDSKLATPPGKNGLFKLLVRAFMPLTLSDVYELSPATHYEPRPPVWCL